MYEIQRGDIYLGRFSDNEGSIQKGNRPCVVISNDTNNVNSSVVWVIPLTSNTSKNVLPVHVEMGVECGLLRDSIAVVEQTRPMIKTDLLKKLGKCTEEAIQRLEMASRIQNGSFDKDKVDMYIKSIREIDHRFGTDVELIAKEILVSELKVYCMQYKINYEDLLYPSYTKVIKIPSYKRGVI